MPVLGRASMGRSDDRKRLMYVGRIGKGMYRAFFGVTGSSICWRELAFAFFVGIRIEKRVYECLKVLKCAALFEGFAKRMDYGLPLEVSFTVLVWRGHLDLFFIRARARPGTCWLS